MILPSFLKYVCQLIKKPRRIAEIIGEVYVII